MNVLRNFDQIFIMGNSNIYSVVRNLLFQIYTDGIIKFKMGAATAAATMVLATTLVLTMIVRKIIKYDESYNS
jgi:putative aldouronate transport system permease protein